MRGGAAAATTRSVEAVAHGKAKIQCVVWA
jgi:hypothetical protein